MEILVESNPDLQIYLEVLAEDNLELQMDLKILPVRAVKIQRDLEILVVGVVEIQRDLELVHTCLALAQACNFVPEENLVLLQHLMQVAVEIADDAWYQDLAIVGFECQEQIDLEPFANLENLVGQEGVRSSADLLVVKDTWGGRLVREVLAEVMVGTVALLVEVNPLAFAKIVNLSFVYSGMVQMVKDMVGNSEN